MKYWVWCITLSSTLASILVFYVYIKNTLEKTMIFEYPNPRRDENVVDNYHGVEVKDPYRWMEDPDSEETKKYVADQNDITQPFLENYADRSKINDRLTKLWNYTKYYCPAQHGGKYYYFMNTGLQNQNVLYVQDSLASEGRVFFDPNQLSEDGTVSVSITKFSEDDKIMAYGLSQSGSDWISIRLKKVDTGEDYPEVLENVKFSSVAWTHDNVGFFYGCFTDQHENDGTETELVKNQKVFYHRVNTPQSSDIPVVEFPDESNFLFRIEVSDCGRYVIVTAQKGCKDNLVYICDLEAANYEIKGKLKLIPVVEKMEADYEYISNDGRKFLFRTNKNAPNFQLITIDLDDPREDKWITFLAEREVDVLEWAHAVNGDQLILCYISHVKNILQLHDLKSGKFVSTFPLGLGTIAGFRGRRKYKDIFYKFGSFLTPGIIYHCDLSKPELCPTVWKETKVENFDVSKFTTEQAFYESKDGTKVPMYIIYKKTLKKNGKNPCLLYGYGGFQVNLLPAFAVSRLIFLDNYDGIYAVANIRGGGEYGEKWHISGCVENKQNGFDDFHAAAEYLIREKYTDPKLLAINGGSNGGLLVVACALQRPNLYGVAVANVGVFDMLRFHKFTIGYFWVTDYGSSADEKQFKALMKYSPLHNVKVPTGEQDEYPAILLLTADHDDRVVPLHSLKLIATLQEAVRHSPYQKNPILIKVETKAGHGSGKPTSKMIEEIVDMQCFIAETMNLKFHD